MLVEHSGKPLIAFSAQASNLCYQASLRRPALARSELLPSPVQAIFRRPHFAVRLGPGLMQFGIAIHDGPRC
jgi:hypothetical protein